MEQSVRNKSNVGIWTRIKNIYNNSPWHAAFTYPILYIIVVGIFFSLIGEFFVSKEDYVLNIFYYFALVLLFSIYLTPVWVFVGLIVSKKKIPYVLSLCIGLGLFTIAIYIIYISFPTTPRM